MFPHVTNREAANTRSTASSASAASFKYLDANGYPPWRCKEQENHGHHCWLDERLEVPCTSSPTSSSRLANSPSSLRQQVGTWPLHEQSGRAVASPYSPPAAALPTLLTSPRHPTVSSRRHFSPASTSSIRFVHSSSLCSHMAIDCLSLQAGVRILSLTTA